MKKHLVLIGAGHVHLLTIRNIALYRARGHQVTVINSYPYHYHSGMGAGLFSGFYTPQEIRFNVEQFTVDRGGEFIEDIATSIDPINRVVHLISGKHVGYDVVSFNTGSEVDPGTIDTSYFNVFKAKPINNLYKSRCKIMDALQKKPQKIVIIGGGPSGVEIACNAWRIAYEIDSKANITLFAKERILHNFPQRVRSLALKKLNSLGILVEENTTVVGNTKKALLLENGRSVKFDFALVATGTKPSSIFRESGLRTGESGKLLVNDYLQAVDHPEIFGSGDCICFGVNSHHSIPVHTVQDNQTLACNLYKKLNGEPLFNFKPRKPRYYILNMGDDTGILNYGYLTFAGKIAMKIKKRIDEKFTGEFQHSNELNEFVEWFTGRSHYHVKKPIAGI